MVGILGGDGPWDGPWDGRKKAPAVRPRLNCPDYGIVYPCRSYQLPGCRWV